MLPIDWNLPAHKVMVQIRKDNGVNQEDVAKHLGKSQQTISNYETDTSILARETPEKLRVILTAYTSKLEDQEKIIKKLYLEHYSHAIPYLCDEAK